MSNLNNLNFGYENSYYESLLHTYPVRQNRSFDNRIEKRQKKRREKGGRKEKGGRRKVEEERKEEKEKWKSGKKRRGKRRGHTRDKSAFSVQKYFDANTF